MKNIEGINIKMKRWTLNDDCWWFEQLWLGQLINSDDNKSIKSALLIIAIWGSKKRSENRNVGRKNSITKMVQQMIKSMLTNAKMIRNEKSYFLLLSFFVFCVAKSVVFYHFFGPIPFPSPKFVPRYLTLSAW